MVYRSVYLWTWNRGCSSVCQFRQQHGIRLHTWPLQSLGVRCANSLSLRTISIVSPIQSAAMERQALWFQSFVSLPRSLSLCLAVHVAIQIFFHLCSGSQAHRKHPSSSSSVIPLVTSAPSPSSVTRARWRWSHVTVFHRMVLSRVSSRHKPSGVKSVMREPHSHKHEGLQSSDTRVCDSCPAFKPSLVNSVL